MSQSLNAAFTILNIWPEGNKTRKKESQSLNAAFTILNLAEASPQTLSKRLIVSKPQCGIHYSKLIMVGMVSTSSTFVSKPQCGIHYSKLQPYK